MTPPRLTVCVSPPMYRAGGQQPANDRPAWQDVRAQDLIGRMDHSTDVADQVAAQGLALCCGQVLSLKPVLIPLLLPKTHLDTQVNSPELDVITLCSSVPFHACCACLFVLKHIGLQG